MVDVKVGDRLREWDSGEPHECEIVATRTYRGQGAIELVADVVFDAGAFASIDGSRIHTDPARRSGYLLIKGGGA